MYLDISLTNQPYIPNHPFIWSPFPGLSFTKSSVKSACNCGQQLVTYFLRTPSAGIGVLYRADWSEVGRGREKKEEQEEENAKGKKEE